MHRKALTLLEILVIIVVIGILAGLLLPHGNGGHLQRARMTSCAHNMVQLYKVAALYSSSHKGEWPTAKGEEFWLSLTRTIPPLIEPDQREILACPVRDEELQPGETHYRGPRVPW